MKREKYRLVSIRGEDDSIIHKYAGRKQGLDFDFSDPLAFEIRAYHHEKLTVDSSIQKIETRIVSRGLK